MRVLRVILKSPIIILVIIALIVLLLMELGVFSLDFFTLGSKKRKDEYEAISKAEAANKEDDLAKASKIDNSIKKLNTLLKDLVR